MVMTTEFRETIRIFKEIQSVKPTANLEEVIYVPPDGGSHHLRRLTPQLRFLMHVFITIPKGILNFVLPSPATHAILTVGEVGEAVEQRVLCQERCFIRSEEHKHCFRYIFASKQS